VRESVLRVAITARAVAPWHGHGGLERHVSDLVRQLTRHHVEVTLIVPPASVPNQDAMIAPDAGERLRIRTVPYVTFPGAGRRGTTILDRDTAYPLFGWRCGRLARQLAEAGLVDVVHGLGASVFGYALAKRHAPHLPPLVLNPQGLEEFGATDPVRAGLKVRAYWPLQRVLRQCARAADAIIATDASLAPVVTAHLGVPATRVAVVPNAVDLAWCDRQVAGAGRDRVRAAHGLTDDPVLLSVGRVEKNKGFHILAAALGRLAAREQPFTWVHVGDGSFRDALRQQVRQARLDAHVIWRTGTSDSELHAWYEAADLFVHPTLYEGSSLVTLEAMAHRLPVVATRAGGLPDKVQPDRTGWLVPPGDVGALESALLDAIAARPRWPAMGAAGRQLAERTFDWPAVVGRLLRVYDRLLAGR
jgi:glycosyltransferase involved in cell wall biosynthesis